MERTGLAACVREISAVKAASELVAIMRSTIGRRSEDFVDGGGEMRIGAMRSACSRGPLTL